MSKYTVGVKWYVGEMNIVKEELMYETTLEG